MTRHAAIPKPAEARPPMDAALLTVRNLYKTYRLGRVEVPVLRGATLDVREGEWVAILGASGSGKSTLLHLIGGLDRPDPITVSRSGRCGSCGYDLQGLPSADVCPECGSAIRHPICFDGRALDEMSRTELDRYRARSVGFVFQFYHLLPELNVLENVLLGAMVLHGWLGYPRRRAALRARANDLLASFGLDHRLAHRPAEISGGERQRVAIARALINEPRLLLADEPTGNLDRETGRRILDAIAEVRGASARTIVMVTHDPEVAARADRVVHLEDGRVLAGSI